MENFGWKGLGISLYQRLFISNHTTIGAAALEVGMALLSYLGGINLPPTVQGAVHIASTLLALYKSEKQLGASTSALSGNPLPVAPKGS